MKSIKLTLNQEEEKLLQELMARGYRAQEAFRMALRELHRREFPPYVVKSKKIDPEMLCKISGGEVVIIDGEKKCQIIKDNVEIINPL